MISQQLVDEVVKEATKLRDTATAEELELLDFDEFDPLDVESCVYGQMTSECTSRRAVRLIRSCATKILFAAGGTPCEASCSLEHCSKKDFESERRIGIVSHYFSPIEIYIAQDEADSKHLIDFLKGNVDTLDLTHTINC